MEKKAKRWLSGILAAVIMLAALLGMQILWQSYAVAKPLQQLSQNINGVECASLDDSDKDHMVLHVTLHNVENLQKTYHEIVAGSHNIVKGKPVDIMIHDARTPKLEQMYYDIHYYIQEAIFTGNFSLMAMRIDEQAVNRGLKVKVYVDRNAVYLQMADDTGDMYVAVPRSAAGGEVN